MGLEEVLGLKECLLLVLFSTSPLDLSVPEMMAQLMVVVVVVNTAAAVVAVVPAGIAVEGTGTAADTDWAVAIAEWFVNIVIQALELGSTFGRPVSPDFFSPFLS